MTQTERELLEALKDAAARMSTARNLLTDGNPRPECNWGMLNASDLYAAIAKAAAERVDEYQAFIDTLPRGCDDKMYMQIDHWARQSYVRHKSSVRGQQITAADSMETHIIWATLRWAEENAVSAQLKAERAEPVRGNTGHGHVWSRPDGLKAKCGGPTICAVCAKDAASVATPPAAAHAAAVSEPWQPIDTAPLDRFVLLACPSGYKTTPRVFTTGIMHSDYKQGRWVDHANDDLTDWGMEPTHWMPLPPAPSGVNE